ncbi:hypothetical protein CR513_57576, partial [Mucuna pruriens]
MRKTPSRSKKKKTKTNDESCNPYWISRHVYTIKCNKCDKPRHNIKTCKGKTTARPTNGAIRPNSSQTSVVVFGHTSGSTIGAMTRVRPNLNDLPTYVPTYNVTKSFQKE